ncbi:uracil-DNA glycosylase [Paenibacillus sp. JCM 10914]|uniref:uracil-DNA glycosylase n=1 Tax=Paenibacillus sp. JCM 10914 TaxID=1236974 RepID=UPI0003CCB68A|nr:uracil-DNA glycosylase [Paenibacillus sp. JCM 10914]GAE04311.1 uracil-DNA glycosylase, family 1 [Paenibacillus sp. JCM 10914]
MRNFHNDWDTVMEHEMSQPYFKDLMERVKQQYLSSTVYPPHSQIFRAMEETPYHSVKVVIIGQDPYHGKGQAEGLSFSVRPGVTVPPSLRNIYKELASDVGAVSPDHGSLQLWARQGVLLLNAVLTVREGEPGSHAGIGWETFTDAIIAQLNEREQPIVFILWGTYAQKKGLFIDRNRHLVLESSHPSPFAARKGFFGSRPFSASNAYLVQKGLDPVNWEISSMPDDGDE